MKIAVVTGCLGFIGSHLVDELLASGWMIYGIDKGTYVANWQMLGKWGRYEGKFRFLEKDICELDRLPDCDVVFNLAAESHVGNSIIDGSQFIRTNVGGVERLLNLILAKPDNVCRRPLFFQISTDEVLGDIDYGSFGESRILAPSNPYAASKASAEMLIQAYARTHGIEYQIVRPTNNWGKRQYPEKLIPLSVKLLQRGKAIRLHDEGKPTRSWLHVDDCVNAILTIYNRGSVNEVYHIGGEEWQNIEVVERIVGVYNEDLNFYDWVDLSFRRKGQDVRYSLDDSKLRDLGWELKESLSDSCLLKETIDWYKNNFKW